MSSQNISLKQLCAGIPNPLPPLKGRSNKVPHAPYRNHQLSDEEKKVFLVFYLHLTIYKNHEKNITRNNNKKLLCYFILKLKSFLTTIL